MNDRVKHRTYRELSADGNSMFVGCHHCAWRIRFDYDGRDMQYVNGWMGGEYPGGLLYERISHEDEIQTALDDGIVGQELAGIGVRYTARHHVCVGRDCDGTGDGSCGGVPNVEMAT